ncbi:MAG: hypothetical protein NXI12_07890 [Alphaproteobacteria bacterium]|nr:hypothetical protein [Alphaproteobacteria bacterium]
MLDLLTVTAALLLQTGPPTCEDSTLHRQFDFWTGAWNVYAANGAFGGSNVIEPGANGCVLHEHWTKANGGTGHSLNWVDNETGQWRQLWVGTRYQIDYAGGLNEDGVMVLEGVITYARPGGPVSFDFRGAWTPQDNGHVIQHFQQWNPQTESWADWGLLTYVPKDDDPNGETPAADATGPVIEDAPDAFSD